MPISVAINLPSASTAVLTLSISAVNIGNTTDAIGAKAAPILFFNVVSEFLKSLTVALKFGENSAKFLNPSKMALLNLLKNVNNEPIPNAALMKFLILDPDLFVCLCNSLNFGTTFLIPFLTLENAIERLLK